MFARNSVLTFKKQKKKNAATKNMHSIHLKKKNEKMAASALL